MTFRELFLRNDLLILASVQLYAYFDRDLGKELSRGTKVFLLGAVTLLTALFTDPRHAHPL